MSQLVPSEDDFSQYSLRYSIVPLLARFWATQSFWLQSNENMLSEHQKKQLLSYGLTDFDGDKVLERLDETIELQTHINVSKDQVIVLRTLKAEVLLALKRLALAESELKELELWCIDNNVVDLFSSLTQGAQLDIALLKGDIEQWVKLVDTDEFWNCTDDGFGGIDKFSNAMKTMIAYYANSGDISRAIEIANKRFSFVKKFVDSQYMKLSEYQRAALVYNGTLSPQDIYWLLPRCSDNELKKLAYDASLYYKNMLLESNNVLKKAILDSGDSTNVEDYNRMLAMQRQYDLMNITNLNINDTSTRRILREYRALEDSVYKRCMNAELLSINRRCETKDVAKSLMSDEVAIEFVASDKSYGALILRKGDKTPTFVDLITFSELDECLSPLQSSGSNIMQKIKRVYSGTSERGQLLYEKLWSPLEAHLIGVKRIYYSPVGKLSTIAFGAISDSNRTAIAERYDMRLVSTTATIVAKNKNTNNNEWNALAIGDVCYESDSLKPKRNWLSLKNSLKEVTFFDSLCNSIGVKNKLLLSKEASEAAFRKISGESPAVILTSTHGFYHNAEIAASKPFYINKGLSNHVDSLNPNYLIAPLKRGGIVLARANAVWKNDQHIDDEVDGILTAEEISLLDLSNTKLVVLSACETGLGEVSMTEGVNGLQRGLKLSGVESMILSLWEVNDKAGQEFMQEFFTRLFGGIERHDAFRQTMLIMKQKYPTNPAYWAMFVMLD